jgi:histidine ammonia-lyase
VRGIVFARLASFVEGHGKARPEVARELAAMLGRRLPRIPLEGQVWAGEIIPLGHLMEGFTIELEVGESLLNGSPCAAALAADVALQSAARLALAERVFCLSIEAFNAPLGAYDPELARLWGDPYEARAIRNLNRLLAGAPRKGRRFYQAPVSWEIVVRSLGQAHRTVATLEEVAATSLASSTLNPIYEPPSRRHPRGRAFSNGGYHNAMASPALDMVNASWADLCTLANHHVQKLRNPAVSFLPEGLRHPDEESGYGMGLFGLGQIDFVEEARAAAQRTFVPAAEGDAANDVAEPVFLAYRKALTAARCLDSTLAVLAVVSSQALSVTGRPAPPRLRGFLDAVRAHCPPIRLSARKRAVGRQVDSLRAAFAAAALSGDVDL